jgi:hypothetical protein
MCRATVGPLLAIVGVAGTAAGVALAVVRERVDRLSDARAARQAVEEQKSPDVGRTDFVEKGPGEAGAGESKPGEAGSDDV